jgi:hypothetical protein
MRSLYTKSRLRRPQRTDQRTTRHHAGGKIFYNNSPPVSGQSCFSPFGFSMFSKFIAISMRMTGVFRNASGEAA